LHSILRELGLSNDQLLFLERAFSFLIEHLEILVKEGLDRIVYFLLRFLAY
jgi:hypothetical protein